MRRSVPTLAILLLAVLTASCSRQAEAPPKAAHDALDPALLRNAEYELEYATSGRVRLTDGQYEDHEARLAVNLSLTAVGDLDRDGAVDAAVILVTNTDGSGIFEDLAAVLNHNGQAVPTPPVTLGDRVKIHALNIEGGTVVVAMTTHAADDPMCCPTVEATKTFKLVDGRLEEQPLSGAPTGAPGDSDKPESKP